MPSVNKFLPTEARIESATASRGGKPTPDVQSDPSASSSRGDRVAGRLVLLGAAASLAAAFAAGNAAAVVLPSPGAGSPVEVQVIDRESGQAIPAWRHAGELFVPGRTGARYAVRISNRSPGRVLAVISVDGVNAVTGETAGTGQAGYVLGPWQTCDITGWRKSNAEVAAFYFTSLPDSYAARTERPANVGVIGVAVWRERQRLPEISATTPWQDPVIPEIPMRAFPPAASPADAPRAEAPAAAAGPATPSGQASGQAARSAPPATGSAGAVQSTPERKAPAEKLGTGHGERESSPVRSVQFERASAQPLQTVRIYYDSQANLVARGIIPGPVQSYVPDPFPAPGYVPDPRS